jgi:O-succinylbenzoate synthase
MSKPSAAATAGSRAPVFAKSGVEAAFWDLLAQEANLPLWKLWGGERRSFDVGVSIGGATTDDVLRLADKAIGLGYRRLKVKIWPGFDREPATALRERFPDILLQVDANSAYDLSSWERLKALDGLGAAADRAAAVRRRHRPPRPDRPRTATPICLDESIHSLRDVDAAISLWGDGAGLERLIVNIKPPRVGGFAEAAAIAHRCAEAGVRTWIGGMLDSAWGKAMNLQLNGLPAIDLPGDHFSPGGAYFEEDVTTAALVAEGGRFALGRRAGDGVGDRLGAV